MDLGLVNGNRGGSMLREKHVFGIGLVTIFLVALWFPAHNYHHGGSHASSSHVSAMEQQQQHSIENSAISENDLEITQQPLSLDESAADQITNEDEEGVAKLMNTPEKRMTHRKHSSLETATRTGIYDDPYAAMRQRRLKQSKKTKGNKGKGKSKKNLSSKAPSSKGRVGLVFDSSDNGKGKGKGGGRSSRSPSAGRRSSKKAKAVAGKGKGKGSAPAGIINFS